MEQKLYFDNDISIIRRKQNFWVYSPSTHKWFKTNGPTVTLVKRIIQTEGTIRVRDITKQIYSRHHVKLNSLEVGRILQSLLGTGVFFASKNGLRASIRNNRDFYEIPKDTKTMMAYLHFTHRCNFNCWFCYNRRLTKNRYAELDAAKWIGIVERLKAQDVKEFIITGGEPLLRPDLYDILSRAKSAGTNFTLLTNGSLLEKKKLEQLNTVIDKFVVSFAGFEEDAHHKNKNTAEYDNILNTFKFLSQHAPEKAYVRTVITKRNVRQIEHIRTKLKGDYGITHYTATLFLPNSLHEIDLMPEASQKSGLNDEFALSYKPAFTKFRCGASTNIIAVDCRGDVYPCQNFIEEDEFRLCSILDDGWYQELLSSDIREIFRNLCVDDMNICKDCSYRYLCGGGCPAISYHIYHDLRSHLPFLCSHLRSAAQERIVNIRTRNVCRVVK